MSELAPHLFSSFSSYTQVLVWHTRTEKPVLVNEGKKGFTDSNVEIWHTTSDTGNSTDLEMQIIAFPHTEYFGGRIKGEQNIWDMTLHWKYVTFLHNISHC